MYGIINRAIEGLVTEKFGKESWLKIQAKAGVQSEGFIANQTYTDDITYKLVGAASEVLNIPVNKILEVFGEYWIVYTASKGYGGIIDLCGKDFKTFLLNLSGLHDRMNTIFPKLKIPNFKATHLSQGMILLNYSSTREGLAPMVLGLLTGLSKKFNTQIEVTQTEKEGIHSFTIKYADKS